MAQMKCVEPAEYIAAEDLRQGGVYKTAEGRTYKIISIWETGIKCCLIRKSGGFTKGSHTGVYGVTIFFVSEVYMPAPIPAEPPVANADGPWQQSGRLFYRDGKEMFTINRHESLSPTDADLLCRKLVKLLNVMELT